MQGKEDETVLVAPCGLHCGLCSEYKGDACSGCRLVEGNCSVVKGKCETYACAQERRIGFCHECSEFPCAKLHPAADMATEIPHNMKVFNLCCIKAHGLREFMRNASTIRRTYFEGEMIIGKGPQI